MAIGAAELDGLPFKVFQVRADGGRLGVGVQVHLVSFGRNVGGDFCMRIVPM